MLADISQFIDIHTHILPGLDDGPKSLEESVAMAQCYVDVGIRKIIATPHFIPGTAWAAERERIEEKTEELQEYFSVNKIALEIFPGMEIAYHQKLINRLEKGALQPLAESNVYLLEPAFHDSQNDLLQCAKEIMDKGYGVILAHPERIKSFQETLEPLIELVGQGLRVQLNMGSLLDKFGQQSKQTAMKLIAENSVHYLSSDAHSAQKRRPPSRMDWDKLAEILGLELLSQICVINPEQLLNNS